MQPAQNEKNKKGQANRGAGGGKHRRGERQEGTAEQVFNDPHDEYTKLLLGAAPSLLHPKLGA